MSLSLSGNKRPGRPEKISHDQFFCAAFCLLRTGIPWRDLPSFYGNWHTIYTRVKRWSENGLFWHLLYQLQQKNKRLIDCTWVDSTTVALHRTKNHVGLSGDYLRGTCLSEGQRTDMKVFSERWATGNWQDTRYVITDKGYNFYNIRKRIRDSGKHPVIPRRHGAGWPCVLINWPSLFSLSSLLPVLRPFNYFINSAILDLTLLDLAEVHRLKLLSGIFKTSGFFQSISHYWTAIFREFIFLLALRFILSICELHDRVIFYCNEKHKISTTLRINL